MISDGAFYRLYILICTPTVLLYFYPVLEYYAIILTRNRIMRNALRSYEFI